MRNIFSCPCNVLPLHWTLQSSHYHRPIWYICNFILYIPIFCAGIYLICFVRCFTIMITTPQGLRSPLILLSYLASLVGIISVFLPSINHLHFLFSSILLRLWQFSSGYLTLSSLTRFKNIFRCFILDLRCRLP